MEGEKVTTLIQARITIPDKRTAFSGTTTAPLFAWPWEHYGNYKVCLALCACMYVYVYFCLFPTFLHMKNVLSLLILCIGLWDDTVLVLRGTSCKILVSYYYN